MATAAVVYEGVGNTTGDAGKLFEGQSFWLSSAVPQRKWLIENAIANGATIVPLEKQADVLIVDHTRKNAPVGTHSYTYIEQSIRNGTLDDLANHVVGPTKSTDRPVGSMTTASKGSRSKFTEAEDQLLWNFVKPYENAGGATGGNEIYKQLEDAHGTGRHTFQSWRDRWLKHVRFQNRQITESVYAGDADDDGGRQAAPAASPRRHLPIPAQSPASSVRRTTETTDPQPCLSPQTRTTAEFGDAKDKQVTIARDSLQRKLGRLLPSSQTSLSARHWEPVPRPQRSQRALRTEAVAAQHREAGLGTHAADVDESQHRRVVQSSQSNADVQIDGPTQASQPNAIEVQEDKPTQESLPSTEEFTDEEYQLLMNAAEYIIQVGEGKDDGSWEKMAENYPDHSSKAWKVFWEEKVKPDYEKRTVQIKNEQSSQEEVESPEQELRQELAAEAVEKVAGESSRQGEFLLPLQSDEESDGVIEDAVHVNENRDKPIAREAEQRGDGLDSPFESQASSLPPSTDASPFACQWLGCDVRPQNAFMLHHHVGNAHRPAQKRATDERGLLCLWRGCRGVGTDEYGNEIVVNLRTLEEWINHYTNEHISPVRRKHSLGPSINNTDKLRPHKLNNEKPIEQVADQESEVEVDQDEALLVLTRRQRKSAGADGGEALEEPEAPKIEQAGDSDHPSSLMPRRDIEVIDLSSDDEEDDRGHSHFPRRSKRLKNVPQPPHIKDQGFSYVDKAVGSSPPFPAQNSPRNDQSLQKSPSFQLLSPSLSKPPEPNEARKRSAGRGTNSQESNPDQGLSIEVSETQLEEVGQQAILSSPRKRSREPDPSPAQQRSPGLPIASMYERTPKRRKGQHKEDEAPEIPSTPEYRVVLGELREIDGDEPSMLNGSPTPRPWPRNGVGNIPFLGKPARRTGLQDGEVDHTSPLHISMVSDAGIEIAQSSPAQSTSNRSDDLSSEPDLHFETAPNTANLWGTAPSEGLDEDSEQDVRYETAPEPNGNRREKLDTQSLLAQSIPDIDGDPFALPEPEGGWPDDMDDDDGLGGSLKELPFPASHQLKAAEDDDSDDDDASSIASVSDWVAEQTAAAKDKKIATKALLRAISATSCANKTLTLRVRDFIIKHGDIPRGTKGCWSEADDTALSGSNRRELAKVREKHGRRAVDRRISWLHLDD